MFPLFKCNKNIAIIKVVKVAIKSQLLKWRIGINNQIVKHLISSSWQVRRISFTSQNLHLNTVDKTRFRKITDLNKLVNLVSHWLK